MKFYNIPEKDVHLALPNGYQFKTSLLWISTLELEAIKTFFGKASGPPVMRSSVDVLRSCCIFCDGMWVQLATRQITLWIHQIHGFIDNFLAIKWLLLVYEITTAGTQDHPHSIDLLCHVST